MLRCGRAYRNSTVALSSLLVMQKCLCSNLRLSKGLLLVLQSYSRLLGITFYHIRTQDYMRTIHRKGKSLFPCHSIPLDWSMAICIDVIELFINWIYCPALLSLIHTISLTCVIFCLSNGEWTVMPSHLYNTDCVLKKNVWSEIDFSAGLLQLSLVQLRCHTAGCLCLVWITFTTSATSSSHFTYSHPILHQA